MKHHLSAIRDFMTTMKTGFIEVCKLTIGVGITAATTIALAIIYLLPIWAALMTYMDFLADANPNQNLWKSTPKGTLTDYLKTIGQGIILIWIGRVIYQLGKNKRHG